MYKKNAKRASSLEQPSYIQAHAKSNLPPPKRIAAHVALRIPTGVVPSIDHIPIDTLGARRDGREDDVVHLVAHADLGTVRRADLNAGGRAAGAARGWSTGGRSAGSGCRRRGGCGRGLRERDGRRNGAGRGGGGSRHVGAAGGLQEAAR